MGAIDHLDRIAMLKADVQLAAWITYDSMCYFVTDGAPNISLSMQAA
jgi:hypothetical protein